MKFAAILGIKDEIRLLPLVIDHLHRIGVDVIIARDNASTDGSAEYLEACEGPNLRLAPLSRAEESSDAIWAESEGALARSCEADWVLFLDADEFWLPAGGSLHTCAAFSDPDVDLLVVNRFNAVLREGAPALPDSFESADYGQIELVIAAPTPDLRLHLEANPTFPWSTGVPQPKIAVRPDRAGNPHLGHHFMDAADGRPLRRQTPSDLLIAHYPFTDFQRFDTKVLNIRRLLSGNPDIFPGHGAWHWKRWARLAQEPGQLEAEFDRQVLGVDALEELRGRGVLRTAAAVLGVGGA